MFGKHGGGGGHHHHHHHGGGGGGWRGGWGRDYGGYDRDVVTVIDMACPPGTMWDPRVGQCVLARPVRTNGLGGHMRGDRFSPKRQLVNVVGGGGGFDTLGVRTSAELQRLAWSHRSFRGFGAAVGDGSTGTGTGGVIYAKKTDWMAYAPWGLVGAGAVAGISSLVVKNHGTKQMLGFGGLALAAGGFLWVFLGGKAAFHPTNVVATPGVAPDVTVGDGSAPSMTDTNHTPPDAAGMTNTGSPASSGDGPPPGTGSTPLTQDAGVAAGTHGLGRILYGRDYGRYGHHVRAY